MTPSARNTFRLFVAIYPPLEIARALIEELRRLDLPPHRVVPLEQIHVTLQFLGDTPAPQVEQTKESVDRSTAGVKDFAAVFSALPPEKLATGYFFESDILFTLNLLRGEQT